jgi:hypothetical protein
MSRVVSLRHVLMFSILLVSAQCESWDASAPCPRPHLLDKAYISLVKNLLDGEHKEKSVQQSGQQ